MTTKALCTEAQIREMVRTFYAEIRRDEVLGPIFNHHIDDWEEHLLKLEDFWSSILLRTARFSGTPMPKHVALPDLDAAMFQRWLTLFRKTNSVLENQAMVAQANSAAERIAQSLWFGYQIKNNPDAIPVGLH